MSQAKYRKKEFFCGAFYHVFNRGVNKESMFRDDEDFKYYLSKLKQFKKKYKVAILGYCLISNHYHHFLKQLSDIPISKFLLAVNTSYGNYFNRKYNRVGYLAQDRYKQSIIKSDEQFDWIAVYVNCNYELHGLGSAKDYEWSSYRDYLGLRQGTICDIMGLSPNAVFVIKFQILVNFSKNFFANISIFPQKFLKKFPQNL